MNETPEFPDVTDANDNGLPPEADMDSPGAEVPEQFNYTLILAEVIFSTELGPQSNRVQFLSKSNTACFPQSRLLQLQEIAGRSVVNEVQSLGNGAFKKVTVEAVYLLSLINLGWMTEQQFLSSNIDVSDVPPAPVSLDETAAPSGDNVVPLRPS